MWEVKSQETARLIQLIREKVSLIEVSLTLCIGAFYSGRNWGMYEEEVNMNKLAAF
ncbi:hypothetical protein JOC94_001322 [Bacillus thermophilus]|uniref:Uncharacterized protein n=1 Tax=Siminovitchia thermophila TaxID=1245522 RepID=A0ABS2R4M1_9BACI|nr:hypothetical protein [Siminovitchia thermophila]MBM7714350.1 hypothetical protein [Siminovitchia thermophila]